MQKNTTEVFFIKELSEIILKIWVFKKKKFDYWN